jgi:hypothetical protein
LSGRKGLGPSLPLTELARRDSGVFEELKCLFSNTPEVREETEANGGHSGDWTLNRTRSWFDRTRPVSSSRQSGAQVLGFCTSVSGQAPRENCRTQGQSDAVCVRSRSSSRDGTLLDSNRTPSVARPVVAFDHWRTVTVGGSGGRV